MMNLVTRHGSPEFQRETQSKHVSGFCAPCHDSPGRNRNDEELKQFLEPGIHIVINVILTRLDMLPTYTPSHSTRVPLSQRRDHAVLECVVATAPGLLTSAQCVGRRWCPGTNMAPNTVDREEMHA